MASTPTRWHPVTLSVQQNLWNLISAKLMVLNPGAKLMVLNHSTKSMELNQCQIMELIHGIRTSSTALSEYCHAPGWYQSSILVNNQWYLISIITKSIELNQYQNMEPNILWNLFLASAPARRHPVTFSLLPCTRLILPQLAELKSTENMLPVSRFDNRIVYYIK